MRIRSCSFPRRLEPVVHSKAPGFDSRHNRLHHLQYQHYQIVEPYPPQHLFTLRRSSPTCRPSDRTASWTPVVWLGWPATPEIFKIFPLQRPCKFRRQWIFGKQIILILIYLQEDLLDGEGAASFCAVDDLTIQLHQTAVASKVSKVFFSRNSHTRCFNLGLLTTDRGKTKQAGQTVND